MCIWRSSSNIGIEIFESDATILMSIFCDSGCITNLQPGCDWHCWSQAVDNVCFELHFVLRSGSIIMDPSLHCMLLIDFFKNM